MKTIHTLLHIILLKAKPDEVPFNIGYLIIAFVIAWSSQTLITPLSEHLNQPSLYALIHTLVFSLLITAFLYVNKKGARTIQTLLALLGVLAVLNISIYSTFILKLPILALLLSAWVWIVHIFIISKAFEIKTIQSVFLYIFIQLSIGFVLYYFFPEYAQEIQKHFLENVNNNK